MEELEAQAAAKAAEAGKQMPPQAALGNGQPGGKGKGKGKLASRTPENEPICFRWASSGKCSRGDKCNFAHCCQLCFGKHTNKECR